MSLETATYISSLVVSNPDGGDQRSSSDDHLRLIKAVLKRTFPLMDGAVSLSSTQVMYLNDLSASVQLQLNTLRDGPATANYAVAARFANSASLALYANSASVASNIGSIPAARVPDLNATNAFTAAEALRLTNNSAFISFYNTSGSSRTGYIQMIAGGTSFINVEQNQALSILTNGTTRVTIGADGTVSIPGAIIGTISNATNATNATFATAAAFATSAGSSALLSGLAPSDTGGGNTIVQRNSSGYIFGTYFNQSSSDEGNAITSFATFQGDNYIRKASAAWAGQNLEARNISGRTGTTKTLSSSAPSGGSNGDIWYTYLWLGSLIPLAWEAAKLFA